MKLSKNSRELESGILCTVPLHSQNTVVKFTKQVLHELVCEKLTADEELSAEVLSAATLLVNDFGNVRVLSSLCETSDDLCVK